MTVKQKQLLLEYFGYSVKGIDGIEGDNTKRAQINFAMDYGCDISEVNVVLPEARADKIEVEVGLG